MLLTRTFGANFDVDVTTANDWEPQYDTKWIEGEFTWNHTSKKEDVEEILASVRSLPKLDKNSKNYKLYLDIVTTMLDENPFESVDEIKDWSMIPDNEVDEEFNETVNNIYASQEDILDEAEYQMEDLAEKYKAEGQEKFESEYF